MKILSVRKTFFFVGWKNKNVGWKNNLSVEKKMSVGEFPLPKTDMSGVPEFPVMQDQKMAEAGEKRPRAYR